ncbi:MAG TPA: cache domain-containing protein [Candidatus Omnitrophota bacterium]|nr:cache domain-containing protein [Candidatus Omnitrophota bacterium]HRZ14359.1 cache domain-containing protein [Candidatus Omnitrophota bacterium]
MRKADLFIMTLGLCLLTSGIGLAQEKLTVQLVKEKVYAAAKLVEQEGEAAFAKLRDPKGEFRFGGGDGYIWVHDAVTGVMLMHPTKASMEGVNQLDLQDSSHFRFIVAMNQLTEKYKEGWVIYLWPKPGQTKEDPKISFVKLAVKDGRKFVIGCGVYDILKSDIAAAYPNDIIFDQDSVSQMD